MTQAVLYFALGVLSIGLLLFAILPIISRRAQRLAQEDLERQALITFSEVAAQKDHIRAKFAVEMNRQDYRIKELEKKMHSLFVDTEKWRVHAERVEFDFERLNDECNNLKKQLSRREGEIKEHQEKEQALEILNTKDKKRRFALEEKLNELQVENDKADIKIASLESEKERLKEELMQLEKKLPSVHTLNLHKELKDIAEEISAFVKKNMNDHTELVNDSAGSIETAQEKTNQKLTKNMGDNNLNARKTEPRTANSKRSPSAPPRKTQARKTVTQKNSNTEALKEVT